MKGLSSKQRKFLAAYAECGTLVGAQRISNIARTNHPGWLRKSEPYRQAFLAAQEENIDRVVAEINRRAVEGYDELVVYQGALQYEPDRNADGSVKRDKRGRPILSNHPLALRRYSDNLLMFYAKSLAPERFRDNAQVALTGPRAEPLTIQVRFVKPGEAEPGEAD